MKHTKHEKNTQNEKHTKNNISVVFVIAFALIALIFGAMLIAGCTNVPGPAGPITGPNANINTGAESSGKTPAIQLSSADLEKIGLKKISSQQELSEFLKKAQEARGSIYEAYPTRMLLSKEAAESVTMATAPSIADSGVTGAGQTAAATQFSKTNIQVEGVDEADFVKNDNKYIYMISQDKLVIVDAFPGESARIVSITALAGDPQQMFVNKDRLVIFSNDYEHEYYLPMYSYAPKTRSEPKTSILVFDISNRQSPVLLKNYSVSGHYYDARMIGEYAYIISQKNVYDYRIPMPLVKIASTTILRPEVYYFDNAEDNYNFNTIVSVNLFNEDEIQANTFMLGNANTLYVSQNNIYIAYQKNYPYFIYWRYGGNVDSRDRFFKAVVPVLPAEIRTTIEEIDRQYPDNNVDTAGNANNANEEWDKISEAYQTWYNKLSQAEKQEYAKKIQDAINDYDTKIEKERRKTIIHRLSINKGKVEYSARGEVPGYLLNQFSLDEFDGNLRVATTSYFYNIPSIRPGRSGTDMYNNVYVLGNDMKQRGAIEEIAPDEKIYSTRFIGQRLYMVTFRQIDPFFVIDLSNPDKPEVLGKLKIPGFSQYLHPYDENHIIGFGRETSETEFGGARQEGLKLALFDVSDVKNPKEIDRVVIGERETQSEALSDHKAFLFDREKELLVIPVSTSKYSYEQVRCGPGDSPDYNGKCMQSFWQALYGAYVYKITEQGFTEKGRIAQYDGPKSSSRTYGYGYWSFDNYEVKRSLYMDDDLYTISEAKIKINKIADLKNVKEIELGIQNAGQEKEQQEPQEPLVDAEVMI